MAAFSANEAIFLVLPQYYQCKLEFDVYGNSTSRNGNVYCDMIKDRDYCISECTNGYSGYTIIEDTTERVLDDYRAVTGKGYLIQSECWDLRLPYLGKSVFFSIEDAMQGLKCLSA